MQVIHFLIWEDLLSDVMLTVNRVADCVLTARCWQRRMGRSWEPCPRNVPSRCSRRPWQTSRTGHSTWRGMSVSSRTSSRNRILARSWRSGQRRRKQIWGGQWNFSSSVCKFTMGNIVSCWKSCPENVVYYPILIHSLMSYWVTWHIVTKEWYTQHWQDLWLDKNLDFVILFSQVFTN